jgi:uncharacterized membrane protein YciS (DUF1049 family)
MPAELYGPAGALVALVFMVLALMRGDLVPGWVYRQERLQREKAETQAERNTDAIEAIATTVKSALDDRSRRDG